MKPLSLLAGLLMIAAVGSANAANARRDAPIYPNADRCGQAHAQIRCHKVWRHGKRVKVCHRVRC